MSMFSPARSYADMKISSITKRQLSIACVIAVAFTHPAGAQVFGIPALRGPIADSMKGPALPGGQMITDVFIGKNVVGPYLLSWRMIELNSESVMAGGSRLSRDLDYSLDPLAGVLKFMKPLRTNAIARIDYRCAPGKAVANNPNPSLPIQFKLFDTGSSALSFDAVLRPSSQAGAQGSSPSSLMLLGLAGSTSYGKGSSLTSKLYLDSKGGNLRDRGGFKLSDSTKTEIGQFNFGLTRGGKGFEGGDETGIKKGLQLIEASGALRPIHGIQASASFRQMSELPPDGKGITTTTIGQRLAGTLGAAQFQATRSSTSIETGGKVSDRVADRLQLDQKLGARLSATAVVERTQNGSKDAASVAQTSSVSVRSQPAENLNLQGSFQNRILPAGTEDSANLKLQATPAKAIKLEAGATETYNKTSAEHSREASLDYSPGSLLSLSGQVRVKSAGNSETLAGGLSARAKPIPAVEIQGGFRLRDATKDGIPLQDVPDTYDLRLGLNVFGKSLRLTGGYTNNPEDDKGIITRTINRNVGIQSTIGAVDFAGTYGANDDLLATKYNSTLDLKLGWRFARASSIVTAFKESLVRDANLLATDTYSIGLSHRVGSILDLMFSGILTTYEKDGLLQPTRDYKAEARLGLKF